MLNKLSILRILKLLFSLVMSYPSYIELFIQTVKISVNSIWRCEGSIDVSNKHICF